MPKVGIDAFVLNTAYLGGLLKYPCCTCVKCLVPTVLCYSSNSALWKQTLEMYDVSCLRLYVACHFLPYIVSLGQNIT